MDGDRHVRAMGQGIVLAIGPIRLAEREGNWRFAPASYTLPAQTFCFGRGWHKNLKQPLDWIAQFVC
jgi:hypothetical protein